MSAAGVRKRWFLLPALLLAAAFGIALAVGGVGARPASVEKWRDFDRFALFYPGDSVAGYPLEHVEDNDYTTVDRVLFVYGTCEQPRGEGGCAPPLQIQVWSACARNSSMYGGFLAPSGRTIGTRRGVKVIDGGADLELQTADVTIAVFAWTPELALAAVDALRGLNNDVQPGEPLPKPVPGALDGTLACNS